METEPLVIERTYNAPIKRVWEAITDPEKMRQWYFSTLMEFEPEIGFETIVDVKHNGKILPHIWKVTEVVSGKKISYEWKFGGYPGNSPLTMELFAVDEKTRLVLTHDKLESFEGDKYPELAKPNFVEGWTYFIGKALKEFVERQND